MASEIIREKLMRFLGMTAVFRYVEIERFVATKREAAMISAG